MNLSTVDYEMYITYIDIYTLYSTYICIILNTYFSYIFYEYK